MQTYFPPPPPPLPPPQELLEKPPRGLSGSRLNIVRKLQIESWIIFCRDRGSSEDYSQNIDEIADCPEDRNQPLQAPWRAIIDSAIWKITKNISLSKLPEHNYIPRIVLLTS